MENSPSDIKLAGMLTKQSLSGVWIKNVIWRYKVYCVLKTNNIVEMHSSKRNFEANNSAKSTIDLSEAICICSAEYIRPTCFLILTESTHVCFAAQTISDRDEWVSALSVAAKNAIASGNSARSEYVDVNEHPESVVAAPDGTLVQQPSLDKTLFNRIWPVSVLPSPIIKFQLGPRYWLALNDSSFGILPYTLSREPLILVTRGQLRCCGGFRGTKVYFELGRQATTGEGQLLCHGINAMATKDMEASFSAYFTNRSSQGDGNRKKNNPDRLVYKAILNINKNHSLETHHDEDINNLTAAPIIAEKPAPPNELPSSYIPMIPPIKHTAPEKKLSVSERQEPKLKAEISEKDVFTELDFPTENQPTNSSSNTVESSQTASSNYLQINTTKPAIAPKPQQPTMLQLEKSTNGGDYVTVCAPKERPIHFTSKRQQEPAPEPAVDDDIAPFLSSDFDESIDLSPMPTESVSKSPLPISPAVSNTVSSIAPNSGNVQYVSLQISNDVPRNGDGSIRKVENNKSQLSVSSRNMPSQNSSVIYADLDFPSSST